MDNSKIVTVCCSTSVVSNTLCSHFFGQWSYWGYTHAFTLELWGEFLTLMGVDYAWTCLKRTQLQFMICTVWAACPCLSRSAVAMRVLTWVVFVPRASFMPTLRSGSSPSPTRQWAGHIACTKGLHEIIKYAHLKFTVYGRKHTYIHTHNFRQCSHASVGLTQAHPNHSLVWMVLL